MQKERPILCCMKEDDILVTTWSAKQQPFLETVFAAFQKLRFLPEVLFCSSTFTSRGLVCCFLTCLAFFIFTLLIAFGI